MMDRQWRPAANYRPLHEQQARLRVSQTAGIGIPDKQPTQLIESTLQTDDRTRNSDIQKSA
jgi:hypothetical protein